MHIGIVVWSLFENKGGIERNCCNLAAAMLRRAHDVTIFYKKPASQQARPVYPVPDGCALCPLPLDYVPSNFERAKKALAQSGIDILAAFLSWESLLWFPGLLAGTGIPLLVSEENSPARINSKWNVYERHCCLQTADAIHIILNVFLQEYPAALHERIRVFPNPAIVPEMPPPRTQAKERMTILAAGRFVEEVKQFSLLIRAFALVSPLFPGWDLEICGDGPSFDSYRQLSARLDLQDRIRFPGMTADMDSHYAAADIFCIPSRMEGFGMVTVEAQAHSLPTVGFAECPGTNEIIVHGENGFLAEDMTPECLAVHLRTLMEDAGLRARMGLRGKEMLARYAPEGIYDAWEDMFTQTARHKNRTRIQYLTALADTAEPSLLAAQELLQRAHPFDRDHYLRMHARCRAAGEQSPFSEKEVASFKKKQKRFGFAGYTSLGSRLRMLLHRLGR